MLGLRSRFLKNNTRTELDVWGKKQNLSLILY